ncbi:MAG: metallophosphoesterase [Ignavibacteriaceae bacterium]|nr:metallophosphoesterase [Ignavibacteriaceae bacterium]
MNTLLTSDRLVSDSRGYKLIHISDPHLSRQYYREHIKAFKILLETALKAGADHILITGDIISTADPDDFYLAREIFARFGLLDSRKLTVVPGNHDIFGGPHRAVDVLSFPKYIRNVDYEKHLKLFCDSFAETFEGVKTLVKDSLFPFIKQAGPFSILGLNSISRWSLWNNPLGSNGSLSVEQVVSLKSLIESNVLVEENLLVAMHHHFHDLNDEATQNKLWKRIESKTMRMKKRKSIIKLFNKFNVSYVLHGHVHMNEFYEKKNIKFMNGAGAVCDDPIPYLKYNVIECENGKTYAHIEQLNIPYQTSALKKPLNLRYREASFVHSDSLFV